MSASQRLTIKKICLWKIHRESDEQTWKHLLFCWITSGSEEMRVIKLSVIIRICLVYWTDSCNVQKNKNFDIRYFLIMLEFVRELDLSCCLDSEATSKDMLGSCSWVHKTPQRSIEKIQNRTFCYCIRLTFSVTCNTIAISAIPDSWPYCEMWSIQSNLTELSQLMIKHNQILQVTWLLYFI